MGFNPNDTGTMVRPEEGINNVSSTVKYSGALITIAEAERQLASSLGVDPEKVGIAIEA